MTRDQIVISTILGMMLALFLWNRLRYDLVALLALLAGVVSGVIPAAKAFTGFSNDLIPLIGGALVVSAAIGRSGIIDAGVARIVPYLRTPGVEVTVLAATVAVLSAFVKNVGALAIFVPIAIQLARRNGRRPSRVLMPLSFASLIGGSMTLIGTSPNILISGMRQELEGQPFTMFAFFPVGAATVVAGLAVLSITWRLLPDRRAPTTAETQFEIDDYTTEIRLPEASPLAGKTIADLEKRGLGDATVTAIIRDNQRRPVRRRDQRLREHDVLIVEGDPEALKKVVDLAGLELVANPKLDEKRLDAEETVSVEAVVTPESELIGLSPATIRLRERFGLNLLAVSRRGRPVQTRIGRMRFQAGDVLILRGNLDVMPDVLSRLGCLPLAARNIELGRPRKTILVLVILAAAIAASTSEIVPAAVAFVAAAAAIGVFKVLTLREIYQSIEWPILVMLGSLIPVGEAVRQTGAADLVAHGLYAVAAPLPGPGILSVVMVTTMLITPLVHHAASVIIMAPVAASLAHQLGLHVDPLLMAVAIGGNSDFLSPIGHQNNTLVLGPGGYRFTDYWRLGLPLSVTVVIVATAAIALFWPLR